jgi:hypothetical protein
MVKRYVCTIKVGRVFIILYIYILLGPRLNSCASLLEDVNVPTSSSNSELLVLPLLLDVVAEDGARFEWHEISYHEMKILSP